MALPGVNIAVAPVFIALNFTLKRYLLQIISYLVSLAFINDIATVGR